MTEATIVADAGTPAPDAPPVVEAPVAAAPVVAPAPAAPAAPAAPEPVAAEAPAAPAEAAPKTHEFAPSLIEEAAKPATAEEPKTPQPGEKPDPASKEAAPEPTTAPEAPPAAPVEYEFAFPEGFDPKGINQERLTEFKGVLSESHVPKEQAQKFVDMHLREIREVASRISEHQWNEFAHQQQENIAAVKADPVVGGARHQTAMRECASFVEQFGGDTAEERQAVFNVLRSTGAGNALPIVKMIHRAALALAREGTPVAAPPPRARSETPQERGMRRYQGSTPGA